MKTKMRIMTVADNFGHRVQIAVPESSCQTEADLTATRRAMWKNLDANAAGLDGGLYITSEHIIEA